MVKNRQQKGKSLKKDAEETELMTAERRTKTNQSLTVSIRSILLFLSFGNQTESINTV